MGLTVAITGPTGDIGRALLRQLDKAPEVDRIIGMARRPFNPTEFDLEKTVYRQGVILDEESIAGLAEGVDVLVHLAFVIFGSHEETHRINLEGTRNVFNAATSAGVKRFVYTSSVAAYGFHSENPLPLIEDVPARGTEAHYYSAQKAELEETLREALGGAATETYVFRPCIVAGGDALALVEAFPALLRKAPVGPVLPDPGTPFQLVHTEDVATALAAAVRGDGPPGVYNLAGDGTITAGDLARAFGWLTVPMPKIGVDIAAEAVARAPFMPAQASWLEAMRVPVVMSSERAREQLGWEPLYDTRAVLEDTVSSARDAGLL